MGTTQPIRDREKLRKFTDYYCNIQPSARNYALIIMGLHTALRISDILNLKWSDVYDTGEKCFCTHLFVREKKTGKMNVIALNRHVKEALEPYRKQRNPMPEEYIFTKNTSVEKPLCRSQAYRIIKKAADNVVQEEHISCHSLRKTFGYHAWKQGTPPALLMEIYNHSSYSVTKHYLGIDQDERDSIFMGIEL